MMSVCLHRVIALIGSAQHAPYTEQRKGSYKNRKLVCVQYLLRTIEFSVFTFEVSGEQYICCWLTRRLCNILSEFSPGAKPEDSIALSICAPQSFWQFSFLFQLNSRLTRWRPSSCLTLDQHIGDRFKVPLIWDQERN